MCSYRTIVRLGPTRYCSLAKAWRSTPKTKKWTAWSVRATTTIAAPDWFCGGRTACYGEWRIAKFGKSLGKGGVVAKLFPWSFHWCCVEIDRVPERFEGLIVYFVGPLWRKSGDACRDCCRQNCFSLFWHFVKFLRGSHVFSNVEYPFHLIRYCWFLCSSISSIANSISSCGL